jgi:hypothetical protein
MQFLADDAMTDVSRIPALTNAAPRPRVPGYRMLYAFGAAIALGLPLGFLHEPYWPVVVIGLAAAVLALWLEREPIMAASQGREPTNFYLTLAVAFVFVAIICIGCVAVGCFVGEWLRLKV